MYRFVPAVLVAACLIISNAALGADWIGPAGTTGDFSDPNNWSLGLVPSGTSAKIANGGIARINPADVITDVALTIGESTGASGHLVQDGGSMVKMASNVSIIVRGGDSTSTFLQKSGTTSVYGLVAGATIGGAQVTIEDGYLELAGSLLLASGVGMSGGFVQKGGNVTMNYLRAGDYGTGTVNIDGGNLQIQKVVDVGYHGGSCSIFQTSGTVTNPGYLYVGNMNGASGLYDMSGGSLNANWIYVGYGQGWDNWNKLPTGVTSSATGRFHQTGGTVTASRVYIGKGLDGTSVPGAAFGTYELEKGTLTADELRVTFGSCQNEEGKFIQSGGTSTIGLLTGGYTVSSKGIVEISGGNMTVGNLSPNKLCITGTAARLTVTGTVSLLSLDEFSAVAGSAMHHHGTAFKIYGSNSAALAGLENLSLYVAGQGASAAMQLEVAGADLGAVPGGFVGNFAFDSLILGEDGVGAGRVQLVDLNDNQPGSSISEAMYVHHLVIGAGSELDLNGLNLYYETFENAGGTVILNGGSLQQAPEPASVMVFLVGAGVVLRRRRNRAA